MTPSFDDLRLEGDTLRLRLEHLLVADALIGDFVGDVRAWQILCLATIGRGQPARLTDFATEVGPVEPPFGDRPMDAGSLARLDHSLGKWLTVIEWMRVLDDSVADPVLVGGREIVYVAGAGPHPG